MTSIIRFASTPGFLAAAIALSASTASVNAASIPVYIFAGQSNAVGNSTDSNALPANLQASQPTVLYSGPQESAVNWGPLTPPTQFSQTNSGHGFGPELTTGKTISAALGGATVAEVKFAVGGTNLYSQWDPNTAGSLYSQMVTRVNSALAQLPTQHGGDTGYIAGFFWMQGESDAQAGRTTAQYQNDLTNLIAKVRSDFSNPTMPFVYGLINNSGGTNAEVRQAQFNVDTAVNNAVLVNTDGYERAAGDAIHFSTQGTVDMGIGFGNGYLSVVPEPASIGFLGFVGLMLRRRVRKCD